MSCQYLAAHARTNRQARQWASRPPRAAHRLPAAALAKVAGGLLALELVRPRGQVAPRRWLLIGSAGASLLLVVYGGLNVLLGALVLSGVILPPGSVDRTALRWHVGVLDLWFLVWVIFLALATVGYTRRTANRTAP